MALFFMITIPWVLGALNPNTGEGPTYLGNLGTNWKSDDTEYTFQDGKCQVLCSDKEVQAVTSMNGQTSLSVDVFRCRKEATITSVFPEQLYTAFPQNLTLTGENFYLAPSISCIFDNTFYTTGTFLNDAEISCAYIPLLPGKHDVSVSINQFDVSNTVKVTYVKSPRIASAKLENGTIHIIGSGLREINWKINENHETPIVVTQNLVTCSCPAGHEPFTLEIVDSNNLVLAQFEEFQIPAQLEIISIQTTLLLFEPTEIYLMIENFEEGECIYEQEGTEVGRGNFVQISETEAKCETPETQLSENLQYQVTVQTARDITSYLSFYVAEDYVELSAKLDFNYDVIVSYITNFTFDFDEVWCKFQFYSPVQALTTSDSQIVCPGLDDIGLFSLELSFNNGLDYATNSTEVQYNRISQVYSLSPSEFLTTNSPIVAINLLRAYDTVEYSWVVSDVAYEATIMNINALLCSLDPISTPGVYDIIIRQDGKWDVHTLQITISTPTTLLGFQPARLHSGTQMTLIGTDIVQRTNIGESILCRFGPRTVATTYVSPTEISCVVPGEELNVELTQLDVTYTDPFPLALYPTPTMTQIDPNFLFEGQYTTVFVTGTNLLQDSFIKLDGHNFSTTYNLDVLSETYAKFHVRIVDLNWLEDPRITTSLSVNGVDFYKGLDMTLNSTPTMGTISIPKGPFLGGYEVKIRGAGFGQLDRCMFGEVEGAISVIGSSEIVCEVPFQLPNVVEVRVAYADRIFDTRSLSFSMIGFVVYTFLPKFGPSDGGTNVTLTGDFSFISPDDTITVQFGDYRVQGVYISENSISCTTPAQDGALVVSVRISVNDFEYTAAASGNFEYLDDFTLGTIFPDTGPSFGGTRVTITGTNFQQRFDMSWVFGGVAHEPIFKSSTELDCIVPQILPGNYEIGVQLVQTTMFGQNFYVHPDMAINSLTPTLGSRTGGTLVTLSGINLQYAKYCVILENLYKVIGDPTESQVVCQMPADDFSRDVAVDVSSNSRNSTQSNVYYTYYTDPIVTSISPLLLPSYAGSPLTLYGIGFNSVTYWRIAGDVALAEFVSDSEIICTVPETTIGQTQIELTFNLQDFHETNMSYLSYTEIVLNSLYPIVGRPGTDIEVFGQNILNELSLCWEIGGVIVPATFVSMSQVSWKAPNIIGGTYDVKLSNNGINWSNSVNFKLQYEIPLVYIAPFVSNTISGNTLTIRAQYLEDLDDLYCKFTKRALYDSDVVKAEYVNSTAALCSVPESQIYLFSNVHLTNNLQQWSKSYSLLTYLQTAFAQYEFTGKDIVPCDTGHTCTTHKLRCEMGHYQDENGQIKWKPCARGMYCPEREITTPELCRENRAWPYVNDTFSIAPCPAGLVCKSGSSTFEESESMTYCPAGQFWQEGRSEQPCTPGFICKRGSHRHFGQSPCPTGYYWENNEIIPCPIGHYCPGRGNREPIPCPTGKYNPIVGQRNCTLCSFGRVCDERGLTLPKTCTPGFIWDGRGISIASNLCKPGHYWIDGVVSSFVEKPCYNITASNALDAGYCGDDVLISINDTENIGDTFPEYFGERYNLCCWSNDKVEDFIRSLGETEEQKRAFEIAAQVSGPLNGLDIYHIARDLILYDIRDTNFTFPPQDPANQQRRLQDNNGEEEEELDGESLDEEEEPQVQDSPALFEYFKLKRAEDRSIMEYAIKDVTYLKRPTQCLAGTYCLDGVKSTEPDEKLDTPFICSPGTYCELGTGSIGGSGQCARGEYCPPGSPAPLPASPGAVTATAGSVSQIPCVPGTYSNVNSTQVCTNCPSGYSCLQSGAVWPDICSEGSYREQGPSLVCQVCPMGTWSFTRGLISMFECLPCPEGRLCTAEGYFNVTESVPCIQGDIWEEAAHISEHEACPAGYVCGSGTTPSTKYDNICQTGFYCLERTPKRNQFLNQCPGPFYCPPGTYEYEQFIEPANNDTLVPPTIWPRGTGADDIKGKEHILDWLVDKTHEPSLDGKYLTNINPLNLSLIAEPHDQDKDLNSTLTVGESTFFLFSREIALITFDLRHISSVFEYGTDWAISYTISDTEIALDSDSEPVSLPPQFLRTEVNKFAILEFQITAWIEIYMRVNVVIYDGKFSVYKHMFQNTTSVEIFTPNKAMFGTRDTFLAVIDNTVTLPYNVPILTEDESPPPFLISYAPRSTDNLFRAEAIEDLNAYNPQQRYWNGREAISIPYLPFFSNWKGYGDQIPIWSLFERQPEDIWQYVPPEETKVVTNFDFGMEPTADTCVGIVIECILDEIPEESQPNPRWWELGGGEDAFFHLTALPIPDEIFINWDDIEDLVPVANPDDPTTEIPSKITIDVQYHQVDEMTKQIIQVELKFAEFHDLSEAQRKGEEKIPYEIEFSLTPLGHTALMILFVFEADFYMVLYCLIGGISILLTLVYFCWHRVFSRERPLPKLKCWGYISMMTPEAFKGVFYASLPITHWLFLISILVGGHIFLVITPSNPDYEPPDEENEESCEHPECLVGIFDTYESTFMDFKPASVFDTRIGRSGVCFIVMGLYLMNLGGHMFIPDIEADVIIDEDKTGNIWEYRRWRRVGMHFGAFGLIFCCNLIIHFSYSEFFGNNAFMILVLLQVVGIGFEYFLDQIVNDALLMCPYSCSIAIIQGLVTFGADTFVDFLQAYFIEFIIMVCGRLYMQYMSDWATEKLEQIGEKIRATRDTVTDFQRLKTVAFLFKHKVQNGLQRVKTKWIEFKISRIFPTQNSVMSEEDSFIESEEEKEEEGEYSQDRFTEESVGKVEASPDVSILSTEPPEQQLEPLMDAFGGYANEQLVLLFNIPFIIWLWNFYDETVIIKEYGITPEDFIYYWLFALVLTPFQLIIDVLLHHANEYYKGWVLHDFLDYFNYKYANRPNRWAGFMEDNEMLDEKYRSMEKLCFSSQYYFVTTIYTSGIMVVLLGIETLLFTPYNVFDDPWVFLVGGFTWTMCELTKIFYQGVGNLLGIWKIPVRVKKGDVYQDVNDEVQEDLIQSEKEDEEYAHELDQMDQLMLLFNKLYKDIPKEHPVPVIGEFSKIDVVKADEEVMRKELDTERLTDLDIREKFLHVNRDWLINNLPEILDQDTQTAYRGLLIDKFRRMFGNFSPDITPPPSPPALDTIEFIKFSPSAKNIIKYWLVRAKRNRALRFQMANLLRYYKKNKCCYCGNTDLLQVELLENIEDLFFRFKSGLSEKDRYKLYSWNIYDWQTWVRQNARFRTICLPCLDRCDDWNRECSNFIRKVREPKRRVVNFSDAPRFVEKRQIPEHVQKLAMKWLTVARKNMN